MFKFFLPPGHLPPLLLRDNNRHGDSHLGPVSPCASLSPLLPTLGSLTPKWRFGSPSESSSFESAAAAERRPLSVTERRDTTPWRGDSNEQATQSIPDSRGPASRRPQGPMLSQLHCFSIYDTSSRGSVIRGGVKPKIDKLLKCNRLVPEVD